MIWLRFLVIAVPCVITYYGLSAAIIVVDRWLAHRQAQAIGAKDFADRKLGSYIHWRVLIRPSSPLLLYFGATRQTAFGWLLGMCASLVVITATFGVAFAIQALNSF